MATGISKAHCIKCGKGRSTLKCAGCLQEFCFNHLTDHRQELSEQLDEIAMNRDFFRQKLNEQINNQKKHLLTKQIDEWEEDSIKTIQQTARECRQILIQHTAEHIKQIEINLTELTGQIRQTHKENDFNETDLHHFQQKLTQLEKELDQAPTTSIEQDSASLIFKISVVLPSRPLFSCFSHIDTNSKWKQHGITIAGGHGKGIKANQLSNPCGICVDDDDQCIYIADCYNHRIIKWKYDVKSGEIVAGGNGKGSGMDQLNHPTDVIVNRKNNSLFICDSGNKRVIQWSLQNNKNQQVVISDIYCLGITMDKNGDIYVSDCVKSEVKQWKTGDKNGTLVAGGNGKGNHPNQLNNPTYIFVGEDHSVYVSDCNNHRVMKWLKGAKEGIVVADGLGQGNRLTQLSHPQGVIVDHLDNVYVTDSLNHRILRWSKGSKEGCIIVGGNGLGDQTNQLNHPMSLSFDRQCNLYVTDEYNHRIQKFNIKSGVSRIDKNFDGSTILSKFFKKL